ncbi:MAG: M14 family metallopeptidase [Bacteroidales bacterium]
MKTSFYRSAFLLIISFLIVSPLKAQIGKSPEAFFGFEPGSDGNLFDYMQLIEYFKQLDEASPRLQLREIGLSPMGNKMYVLFISSPKNIEKLDRYKEINRKLALDWKMSDAERDSLVDEGKVFLLATLSMHSNEVGPTQASPQIAYSLANTQDPEMLKCLENVVFMIVPNHNPDGMQMVVDNYRKYKGTPYEGCSLPGIYHKYVGHDNNRDFVTLTQQDNKVIAAIYNKDWFPQVMVEKHQMGASGVRYFVPPMSDPIAQNVDEGIWNWSWIFGSAMAKDLAAYACSGVAQHYLFDDYWPGSTATAEWKNMIGLLTEAASVNGATPLYIEKNEIKVIGKGLGENKKGINMPLPWEGGWWRLSDIVRYEKYSTFSILKTASANSKEILQFRNKQCRSQVLKGKSEAPAYFVLPLQQHDKSELVALVNLLFEHGVNVFKLDSDLLLGDKMLHGGDIVIPLAQPFRAFVKEVMEAQSFPARHYTPGGELIDPYDITSWSLPLHKGLQCFEIPGVAEEIEKRIEPVSSPYFLNKGFAEHENGYLVFEASNNESYMAAFKSKSLGLSVKRTTSNAIVKGKSIVAGSFIFTGFDSKNFSTLMDSLSISSDWYENNPDSLAKEVVMPRIALVESWFHDMDAGWTRYIFDQYNIPFTVLRPADFAKKSFELNFDVVIFPDEDKNVLIEGKTKVGEYYSMANYPPEFTKGMGKDGFQKVLKFIKSGGTVLSWGNSTALFEGLMSIKLSETENEEFKFPFSNVAEKLKKSGLNCPGSLLKVNLLPNHPLTWGMKSEAGILTTSEQVFQTSLPSFEMDRRVIASYPENHILLSGLCEKEELLGNYAAMVWMKKGKGNLVVYGFNPQFRASTPGVYKLLFNGLLLPSQ